MRSTLGPNLSTTFSALVIAAFGCFAFFGAATASAADPPHLLKVQKVEAQVDLEPGQQRRVTVRCPSGYFVSDGSLRIDHVDQGTGSPASPQVLESRATSNRVWRATVRNTASGRAQAKLFAVCIRRTTVRNDGHRHRLVTGPRVVSRANVPAGLHEVTLGCPAGRVAIQPGFRSTGVADLVYSQPAGNGWKFILDVKQTSRVLFSIRCLRQQTSGSRGHRHNLLFERVSRTVTVGPGQVGEAKLTCPVGGRGIVGGWDLDPGLLSLGNDPRPVTRAFRLFNPTGAPLTARLSLLCMGNRTGPGF